MNETTVHQLNSRFKLKKDENIKNRHLIAHYVYAQPFISSANAKFHFKCILKFPPSYMQHNHFAQGIWTVKNELENWFLFAVTLQFISFHVYRWDLFISFKFKDFDVAIFVPFSSNCCCYSAFLYHFTFVYVIENSMSVPRFRRSSLDNQPTNNEQKIATSQHSCQQNRPFYMGRQWLVG